MALCKRIEFLYEVRKPGSAVDGVQTIEVCHGRMSNGTIRAGGGVRKPPCLVVVNVRENFWQ